MDNKIRDINTMTIDELIEFVKDGNYELHIYDGQIIAYTRRSE